MSNIALKIHTTGLKPESVILSISAVLFDKTGILDTFHASVSRQSCLNLGFTEDDETKNYWKAQSKERLEIVKESCRTDAEPIGESLKRFAEWLPPDSVVWCLAGFDNVFLKFDYERLNLINPVNFYDIRDYRTLHKIFNFVDYAKSTIRNNGLCDASDMALHIIEIFKNLRTTLTGLEGYILKGKTGS